MVAALLQFLCGDGGGTLQMRRREDGAAGTAIEMEVVVVAAPWCAERQWWLKEVLRWRSGSRVLKRLFPA